MNSYAAIAVVLLVTFAASLLIERALGRSRKEFQKPNWYFVFFPLFLSGAAVVYFYVSVESPYIYAAYGLAGAVAALAAQCFFGTKVS